MPIYEYICNDCGNKFEVFYRAKDIEPACRECNSTNIKRIMSPVNANFEAWLPEWKKSLDYANQPEP